MALADHSKEAWAGVRNLKKSLPGIVWIVTPIVLQELAHLHEGHCGPEKARLSTVVLDALAERKWPAQIVDLRSAYHGVSDIVADKLRFQKVIPAEERNDAYFIAECALSDCEYILSADGHITKMDKFHYRRILKDSDLDPPELLSLLQAKTL